MRNLIIFPKLQFDVKNKQTHGERFLNQIEAATSCALVVTQAEALYPKGERS